MKKIFIEVLPRWINNRYKDEINWHESIGHKIHFIYDNIEDDLTIVSYNQNTLGIKYKENEIFMIKTDNFTRCKIGNLIGVNTSKYKYKIGETLTNNNSSIVILEQIKINFVKGYKYKCLKCNNIDTTYENSLKSGTGCNVCGHRKVLKGYNDITTLKPQLIQYFINKEDAFLYSCDSNKKMQFQCPDCGHKKNMSITNLNRKGFSCPKCGDGVSYPNKIMFNVLEQLNVDYEIEKRFNWSNNRIYDFYLSSFKCIIEIHGIQHYEDSFNKINNRARNLIQEQDNDKYKEKLAKDNIIKSYIIINAKKSNLEWIKDNILNSKLNELFDLLNIDWDKCEKYAQTNLIKITCDLWNTRTKDTKIIANLLKINRSTVIRYLKKGASLSWCNYDRIYCKRLISKPIICLENNYEFTTARDAEKLSKELFGFSISRSSIQKSCINKTSIKGLNFRYIERVMIHVLLSRIYK